VWTALDPEIVDAPATTTLRAPRVREVRRARNGIAVAALLALGSQLACVRYEARPLSPEEGAAALQERSLDSPELRAFVEANRGAPVTEWPLPSWDVESLVLAAYHFHPDLAVARAEWAVLQAGSITAGQRPNPSLLFLPQYNSTTPTALISPWVLPVEFGVILETAGKRRARLRRAQYLSRSAWWSIAETAWNVRQRVRTRMLQLQGAQARAGLLQERWEVQDEWMRALDRREQVGEISRYDDAFLRVATRSLNLARLEARREVRQAQAGLAAAVGIPVAALERVALRFASLEQPPPPLPEELARLQALINRTDILALLAEYEAAQEGLRLEIARQYPDVKLGPGYEFDQGDHKWVLGISLDLPLFNRNRGPIAEAEARREAAAARVEEAQTRVLSEIDVALAALASRAQEAAVADSLVDAAVERERRVREYHEAGEFSGVDVLVARAETLKAREDLLRVQVAARQAHLDLENALQSPADWSASFLEHESAAVRETGTERNR